jgi:hypothetical protein
VGGNINVVEQSDGLHLREDGPSRCRACLIQVIEPASAIRWPIEGSDDLANEDQRCDHVSKIHQMDGIARTSFVHGNFIAAVLLCQSLADTFLLPI